MRFTTSLRILLPVLSVLCTAGLQPASAQQLLRDDFDGSGNVDTTVWRLPFGSEGTFVGRTQYRGDSATDVPQQGIAEASASDNAVMEIHLDTYSPIDPGNQFLGTDLLTKRNFARAGGLTFEASLRLKPTTSGGLVNGFFLYDVTRDSPPGANNLVRDEIDWELISNQAAGPSPTHDAFSNFWDEGPFSGPGAAGSGEYHDVAGLDLTQFNDYKVEWTPQSIKWFVNDSLVRTQTTDVPDDPMKLHVNLWAPASDFSDAFNSALQPTASEGSNERYTVQVDHVEVNRINTTASDNMLYDGSFEIELAPTFIGDLPATTTEAWLSFGNVSYQLDEGVEPGTGVDPTVPDQAPDGIYMAKMFGPFNGGADASGILQNVAASPGQEFEARALVSTPAGDSIVGTENFNTIALTFLDSNGDVLQEAFADPGNVVDSNGNDFPLLDGRDPNMPADLFVEGVVNGIAPAGTAFARVSLFFIQLNNEGGASWFDDASLVLLTPDTPAGLLGDYNGDQIVDAADYTTWRDNLGGDESNFAAGSRNPSLAGLPIGAGDYEFWRNNYGSTPSLGATLAAPEPTAMSLLLILPAIAGSRMRARSLRVAC